MTYESELEEIEHKNQMVDLVCDHIINWNGVGVCAQPLQGIKEVYRNATRDKVSRTSAEIFWQTLELARELYAVRGYTVPVGHRFDLATHGHETQAWDGACAAQLMLTNTDLGDVMSDMEESDFVLPSTTPMP